MTCYLHIGTPKTGTTSIQEFLYLNKNFFLDLGFYIPSSIGKKNHSRLAMMCADYTRPEHNIFKAYLNKHKIATKEDFVKHTNTIIETFKEELKYVSQDKIIISSENIQETLQTEEEIIKLKNILNNLNFNKIYIILYIRRPEELMLSLYSMLIKAGYTDERTIMNTPKHNVFFRHVCNHKETLLRFSSIFGKKNIIVRKFEHNSFYESDLLKDF
ncbi:hypothetical protein, partial [Campylobacter volucris]|uniref:hypothetical protein n=1 Tax=Campylobacter volucris TaxID=1031542 RepID=UPI001E338624